MEKFVSYDPASGNLFWRARLPEDFREGKKDRNKVCAAWNAKNAGNIAGSLNNRGYVALKFDGHSVLAHRVAWRLMTGAWPDGASITRMETSPTISGPIFGPQTKVRIVAIDGPDVTILWA